MKRSTKKPYSGITAGLHMIINKIAAIREVDGDIDVIDLQIADQVNVTSAEQNVFTGTVRVNFSCYGEDRYAVCNSGHARPEVFFERCE